MGYNESRKMLITREYNIAHVSSKICAKYYTRNRNPRMVLVNTPAISERVNCGQLKLSIQYRFPRYPRYNRTAGEELNFAHSRDPWTRAEAS